MTITIPKTAVDEIRRLAANLEMSPSGLASQIMTAAMGEESVVQSLLARKFAKMMDLIRKDTK